MASETTPGLSSDDRLTLHLLGSGYGESQVVLFPGPEARCMVVDSCMSKKGGRHLTAALLRRLGKKTIDLLVITHADADHIEGIPELIDEFKPGQVWYSPFVGGLKAAVARWRRQDATNTRLLPLSKTLQKLDVLREEGRADVAYIGSGPWHQRPHGCNVEILAPFSEIDAAWAAKIDRLLKREESRTWIVPARGQAWLDGDRALGDRPNDLSIALFIQWEGRRILLAGDVEATHWAKVLKKLANQKRDDRLHAQDVVKVAHHGSKTGFHEGAWTLHRKQDGSTVALIAPFDDSKKLPDVETLDHLTRVAGRLGITTATGGGFARALEAGWRIAPESEIVRVDAPEPLVSLVLGRDGSTELRASPDARFFVNPAQTPSPSIALPPP